MMAVCRHEVVKLRENRNPRTPVPLHWACDCGTRFVPDFQGKPSRLAIWWEVRKARRKLKGGVVIGPD